jgi:hypothetical protein
VIEFFLQGERVETGQDAIVVSVLGENRRSRIKMLRASGLLGNIFPSMVSIISSLKPLIKRYSPLIN